jgi:hypothetical protein
MTVQGRHWLTKKRGVWSGKLVLLGFLIDSVIENMAATTFDPDAFGAHFALAASPAREMVERGDWKGAAELQVRPNKFPHVMAITYFARALGAARSGNPDGAKTDIAKLAEMRDRLTAAKVAYWPDIVDIQYQIATAWHLYAEGKYDGALKAMSAAADAEDKTENRRSRRDRSRPRANCMALCYSIAACPRRRWRRSRRRWRRSQTASTAMSGLRRPRRRSATTRKPRTAIKN